MYLLLATIHWLVSSAEGLPTAALIWRRRRRDWRGAPGVPSSRQRLQDFLLQCLQWRTVLKAERYFLAKKVVEKEEKEAGGRGREADGGRDAVEKGRKRIAREKKKRKKEENQNERTKTKHKQLKKQGRKEKERKKRDKKEAPEMQDERRLCAAAEANGFMFTLRSSRRESPGGKTGRILPPRRVAHSRLLFETDRGEYFEERLERAVTRVIGYEWLMILF